MIVGFDGSDHSRMALEWAAREGEKRRAAVHVITAFATPPVMSYYGISSGVYSPGKYDEVAEQYHRQAVEAVAKTIAEHPAVGIDVEVVDANPSNAILNEAKADDLIVVGSSGAGRVTSLMLGSVVADLMHLSPCPVVVTPATLQTGMRRIAVAVDGSPHSVRALEWAAREAELWSCDLVVAHVWEYPYRLTDEGGGRRHDATEVDAGIVLDGAVEEARDLTTFPIERRLLEGGTVQRLLDLGAQSDLIVLGSRGRGGFRSMLLGSVSMSVAGHAHCPVVVIPARAD